VTSARYLPIYLNDHLAGATLGVELARRTLGENPDGELGDLLRWLVPQLVEDRASLVAILRTHGRQSLGKVAGAWAAEKVGRLKPNGHLTTYSPLSRLVELEGLKSGIEAKLALWRALQAAGVADVGPLIERANEQRDRLEPHRLAAARAALG
jgi:hypothetical protein